MGAILHLSTKLLNWYDQCRRHLPWREPPGTNPDPYRVWLSEIMLQQTTVTTVKPYYSDFLERWPTIEDLAGADLDDILSAWAGLGYYARARNLHKCAQTVANAGGDFPHTVSELKALPGIGPYTAGAIAAIAFNIPVAAVDGNVERVISRFYGVQDPLPGAKSQIQQLSQALVPRERPGDFLQALMDLGATVCAPRIPTCDQCPWSANCVARREGTTEDLPRKSRKADRPLRYGFAFWLMDPQGRVLLRRRPPEGLLGGMTEIPSTPWTDDVWAFKKARKHAPISARWRTLPGVVSHGFTHFQIEFRVASGQLSKLSSATPNDAFWCAPVDFKRQALPTLMRKLAQHSLDAPIPD